MGPYRTGESELAVFLREHPLITVKGPGISRTGLWEVQTPDGLITFSTREFMERCLFVLYPDEQLGDECG